MHGHAFGMKAPDGLLGPEALNLTDDQKAQMKAVMEKEWPM